MKQAVFILLVVLAFGLGCARVRVEAPKEPIKVDISMRLDIYQHVQKDIDAIEDIVGSAGAAKPSGNQSLLGYFISDAYAQDLSPEVEEAALRRKARLPEVASWMQKAAVGENKDGLLVIRNNEIADQTLEELVKAENKDRMIIYQALAQKNGTSTEEIQKMYAAKLQNNAAAGTPIEALNTDSGAYEWRIK